MRIYIKPAIKACLVCACSWLALSQHAAFGMSSPIPIQLDGGPLGPLVLTGGADGLLFGSTGTQSYDDENGIGYPGTNNAGPKSHGAELVNSLVELQKATGTLQATIEVGALNLLYIGLPITPTSIQDYSTGPLYSAYLTLAPPGMPFTVSAGQLSGLEGFEATQDWNNANIFLSALGYFETGQSRGANFNYTKGALNIQAFFNDGYDTGVFNSLQMLAAYTFNSTNSASVYYGGNLGRTGLNANTYGNGSLPYDKSFVSGAPQYANSQLIGAYYNTTLGGLNLVPEVQYQYAKQDHAVNIQKGMYNFGAAVFADYSFGASPYSIGGFVQYVSQHESAADAVNNLFWIYGANANFEQISITPTWQYKNLFARTDIGVIFLNRTNAYGLPKYGYGNRHDAAVQATGFLEAGVTF